jgi:hypothetical protein
MRFSTLSFALLPLLALAEDTTTLTSTATMTRTVTVSEVVASVTSTYGMNTTSTFAYATGASTSVIVGTTSSIAPAESATSTGSPENFMGAASSLNGMYAGGAGLFVMIAAALL